MSLANYVEYSLNLLGTNLLGHEQGCDLLYFVCISSSTAAFPKVLYLTQDVKILIVLSKLNSVVKQLQYICATGKNKIRYLHPS